MAAATIRVTMFPEGRVVDTKLSQITSGSLLTCASGVMFRHYDNSVDCYMWTSNDGDRFTDDDLQELLVADGEFPVVMRYK